MTDVVLPKPTGITRIVYKEIVAGDLRKFKAQSHDTPSGGGARDLRFRPYSEFRKVFERMLPTIQPNGVFAGQFMWVENGIQKTGAAFFHPPTSARPNEGRIANVNKYLPQGSLPAENDSTIILMIVQRDDGSIWPCFTTTRSLESGGWHAAVSEPILNCLRARRRSGTSCSGYIDYVENERFCNGI